MAHVDVIRLQFQPFRFSSSSFFTPSPFSAKILFSPLAYSSSRPAPPATLAFPPRKHLLSFKVTSLSLLILMHSQLTNLFTLPFHVSFLVNHRSIARYVIVLLWFLIIGCKLPHNSLKYIYIVIFQKVISLGTQVHLRS